MRFLIVAPAWIGDLVLSQPLIARLAARHPGARIDLLVPRWTLGLATRLPGVCAAIEAPFGHGELALGRRWRLARELAHHGYERAWVLPNSFKSALVPWLAGIARRTGYVGEQRYGLLNDARRLDAALLPQMLQRFVALAGDPGEPLPEPLPRPRLLVDPPARQAALERLGLDTVRTVLALCPGAEYGPAKRWPAEHYAAVARAHAAAGGQCWLFGSERDAPLASAVMAEAPQACTSLAGRTTLAEAVDLLSCAQAVVSNDSGLMHIAAALDRPMVAIYGSSSPAFTPPASPHASIVRLALPCSPCFERDCPLGHLRCLRELTPQTVIEKIRDLPAAIAPPTAEASR